MEKKLSLYYGQMFSDDILNGVVNSESISNKAKNALTFLKNKYPDYANENNPRFEKKSHEVMLISLENGMPTLGAGNSLANEKFIRNFQIVLEGLSELNHPSLQENRFKTLANAYTFCQAMQIRVTNELAELMAQGSSLEGTILQLFNVYKAMAFDSTIMEFENRKNILPAKNLGLEIHLKNTYLMLYGSTFHIMGHEDAKNDPHILSGLVVKNKDEFERAFLSKLDLERFSMELLTSLNAHQEYWPSIMQFAQFNDLDPSEIFNEDGDAITQKGIYILLQKMDFITSH
jgi:hypothetical protein